MNNKCVCALKPLRLIAIVAVLVSGCHYGFNAPVDSSAKGPVPPSDPHPKVVNQVNTISAFQKATWASLEKKGVRVIVGYDKKVTLGLPSHLVFIPGKNRFQTSAQPLLKTLFNTVDKLWRAHKIENIAVVAYTDDIGSPAERAQRTKQQATLIASHLWAIGIPANHMEVYSMADRLPVASNHSTHGRIRNARVEIELRGAA